MNKLILIAITTLISCTNKTSCQRLLDQRSNAVYRDRTNIVIQTDSLIKCMCKDEFKKK